MSEVKRYRPANGTEGEAFMAAMCDVCIKGNEDDPAYACPIQLRTMVFEVDDPKYPEEWRYNVSGKPVCTAFVHVDAEPDAPPRCPDTQDLFL